MKWLVVLLLCFFSLIHSQTQYQLNTTLYQQAYEYCGSSVSPIPESCNAFANSSLWIPEGIPSNNDTVILSSTSLLVFVVPNRVAIILTKLSLIGDISLIVEGHLNFTDSKNYSFIVCDTSTVLVQNFGVLFSYMAAFYDQTSLVVQNLGVVVFPSLLTQGTSVSFYGNSMGTLRIGSAFGTIQHFNISGNVFTQGYFNVDYLFVSGNASLDSFKVNLVANFEDYDYSVVSLVARANASIQIYGCPAINYLDATENSSVISHTQTSTEPCVMRSISVRDQATLSFIGDRDLVITTLYQNLMSSDRGVIVFQQNNNERPTSIVLPSSTGPGFLEFLGYFNVTAGQHNDQYTIEKSYIISDIHVEGNVTINVVEVQLRNAFQFVPGLQLNLIKGGVLYLQNTSIYLDQSPGLVWSPNSTIVVGASSTAYSTSNQFSLGEMRKIIIANGEGTGLAIQNFTIEQGSSLTATSIHNMINGWFHVEGTLEIKPSGGGVGVLDISGKLTMVPTGTLVLPQMLEFNYMETHDSSTYLGVHGEAHLAGTLSIELGGTFPSNYTSKNYSIADIPVMHATNMTGAFSEFEGSLTYFLSVEADGQVLLSQRVVNSTVFLRLERPHNKKDNTLYFIIAGVGGAFVLLGILIGFIVIKRRKSGYSPVK